MFNYFIWQILGFFLTGVVLNQLGLIRNIVDVKALSELGILFLVSMWLWCVEAIGLIYAIAIFKSQALKILDKDIIIYGKHNVSMNSWDDAFETLRFLYLQNDLIW